MDKLFKRDEISEVYERYTVFDRYEKVACVKMDDFILEFEKHYNRIKQKDMELPQAVLAFKLLDASKVSNTERQLVLTGVNYAEKETLFNQMKASLRKFHGEQSMSSNKEQENGVEQQNVVINEESEDEAGRNNAEHVAVHVHNDVENNLDQGQVQPKNPTKFTYIDYRMKDTDGDNDDNWREAIVLGRAGKATGAYKRWYNVKDTGTGIHKSLNFDDIEWKTKETVFFCNNEQNAEIYDAKQKELDNWKEHKVYTEVADLGQPWISLRWVISQKSHVVKARLVARGFEEETLWRTDSPTCCKENLRIVVAIIASKSWKINSLDFKCAFLQGKQIDRNIYVKPPSEIQTDKLWKLTTTVYGLKDASRTWYLSLRDELIKLGMTASKYDEALFYWRVDGSLEGLIAAHVDDFCFGGSSAFIECIILALKQAFNISSEESENFKYLGLNVHQSNNQIVIHQRTYINDLEPINLPSKSLDKQTKLNKMQIRDLRQIIGKFNWVSSQSRPDISFDTCEISTNVNEATFEDIQRANKIVNKIKSQFVEIKFPSIGEISHATIVSYQDASFANLKKGGSQGGFVIFLLGENSKYTPICWQSKKLKRVVKSTLGAESLALVESMEQCFLIKTILKEILGLGDNALPIICLTDNKSLTQSAYSTKTLCDKRLKIDMCIIRDMLLQKEISEIRWVEHANQISDCLTKRGASSAHLLRVLEGDVPLL